MPVRGYYGGRLRRRYQAEIVTTRLMWRRFQLGNVGLPRNTAPTLIQYAESSWTTTTASKATPSITWLTGDVIVVVGGTGDQGNTITSVTATGLTFVAGTPLTVASSCWANTWTVTAPSGGSSAVTANISSTGVPYGIGVWVYRGSDGVGGRGADTSTTKTVALGRVDDHSTVVCGVFDWSGGAITSRVWTPSGQTEDEATAVAGQYTAFVADWGDQGTSATIPYGITGTASVGAHSKIALEVLGTISAGGNVNVNDTNPDIGHTTTDVTATITTTDATPPALTHTTSDATASLSASDTPPALTHTTNAPGVSTTTTDSTNPALTHTTSDATPTLATNAPDTVTTHQTFDATISTASNVSVAAELTNHAVVTADPAVALAANAELTQHTFTTADPAPAVAAPTTTAVNTHTAGDPQTALTTTDATAPATTHTTAPPAPGVAVNAPDTVTTHTTYDATVSNAVLVNANAELTQHTLITGDPTIQMDVNASTPANTHQTFDAVASTTAAVNAVDAVNTHTTNPATTALSAASQNASHSFTTLDVTSTQTTLSGTPSISHTAFDATAQTALPVAVYVSLDGYASGVSLDSPYATRTTTDNTTAAAGDRDNTARVSALDSATAPTQLVG